MDCPTCEKPIKAEVEALITDEDVIGGKENETREVVALYLTCEHCKTEMYTSLSTSCFETI